MFSRNQQEKRTLFLAKKSSIKVIITIRGVDSQKLKNKTNNYCIEVCHRLFKAIGFHISRGPFQ
jgi:hypothetical protein